MVTSEVKYWPPSCQLRKEPVRQGSRHRGEQKKELDKTRAASPAALNFPVLSCLFVCLFFVQAYWSRVSVTYPWKGFA